MGELIVHYFDDFVNREYECISLGFKPSGNLHIGSVLTLLQGFLYVKEHPDTKIEINVMDLDYDNNIRSDFHSFYYAKDTKGKLLKDITLEQLTNLSESITAIMGFENNPAHIQLFSEILVTKDNGLLDMIVNMVKDPKLTKRVKNAIYDKTKNAYSVPLTGICPECHTSTNNQAKVINNRTKIKSVCKNKECNTFEYEMNLDDVGGYNIFYLIDPIRDLCIEGEAEVGAHLFGGDYAVPHGIKKKFKAQRVLDIMDLFTDNKTTPDIYIGPMLTYDGKKMSKSYNPLPLQQQDLLIGQILHLIELSSQRRATISYEELQAKN